MHLGAGKNLLGNGFFRENDHPDFSTVLTNTADHFRVHEEAYCANEDLYRWFLQRTCGMPTVGTVDASETIKPPPAG